MGTSLTSYAEAMGEIHVQCLEYALRTERPLPPIDQVCRPFLCEDDKTYLLEVYLTDGFCASSFYERT
jgi:hypothetical protein